MARIALKIRQINSEREWEAERERLMRGDEAAEREDMGLEDLRTREKSKACHFPRM